MEVEIAPVVPITWGVLPEHQKHQLFYGNATFYVFFRLFQVCHDRLAKAKELARSPPNNSQFAFLMAMSQGEDKPESEYDKWKSFMKILYAFCNGTKEQTIFEDECRALFGTQAYVLFTLDKVIVQLTKQVTRSDYSNADQFRFKRFFLMKSARNFWLFTPMNGQELQDQTFLCIIRIL